jgi:hypothetical protein
MLSWSRRPLGRLKRWIVAAFGLLKALAEAFRKAIDWFGDLSIQILRALFRNPTLGIVVATALLFAAARIPTEIFYSSFHVRPEEVGINSVQVLLQCSIIVLGITTGFGIVFALVFLLLAILLLVLHAIFLGLLPYKGPKEGVWKATGKGLLRALRFSSLIMPLVSLGLATFVAIKIAELQVDEVKAGQSLHPQFVPWKAEAVRVHWNPGDSHMTLPPCESLFYLGEGDARVIFYDRTHDETYRINSRDLELEFPEDC